MQYELYIDLFFLINFMMDYLLLRLLNRMLSCAATHVRMMGGAFLGAAFTCVVIVLPIPCVFMKILLFHCFVNVIMLKTGLGIKWGKSFFRALVFLYIGGFLLGGVMSSLWQYLRAGSLFFALSMLGYQIASSGYELLTSLFRHRETHLRVTLYYDGKRCQEEALLDTGNCLRNPVNGKPVSVVSEEVERALGIKYSQKPRRISFQSIGETSGTLSVYVLDKMLLEGERRKVEVCSPEIAVCQDVLTGKEFQVILNPDVYKKVL